MLRSACTLPCLDVDVAYTAFASTLFKIFVDFRFELRFEIAN